MLEAINDPSKTNITLKSDIASSGLEASSGKSLTLDLDGHTLTLNGDMVGSPGYKTNATRFEKDGSIKIKGGTIKSSESKILIQNYANLTLEDVTLEASGSNQVALSVNCGDVILKGDTEIKASGSCVPIGAYYGMKGYESGFSITVEDPSVKITGEAKSTFKKDDAAALKDFKTKAKITVPKGYELDLDVPDGWEWSEVDGKKVLQPSNKITRATLVKLFQDAIPTIQQKITANNNYATVSFDDSGCKVVIAANGGETKVTTIYTDIIQELLNAVKSAHDKIKCITGKTSDGIVGDTINITAEGVQATEVVKFVKSLGLKDSDKPIGGTTLLKAISGQSFKVVVVDTEQDEEEFDVVFSTAEA